MEPTRLHDIPEYQLAKYPKAIAIASKVNGAWKGHSTQELITTAEKVALGLMRLGVKPGDKVALASGNRSEWCLLDQAILRIGRDQRAHLPDQQRRGLTATYCSIRGSKICFCSNAEIMRKRSRCGSGQPGTAHLFTFDRLAGVRHWSEVADMANACRPPNYSTQGPGEGR
jgi:long-chain acyl-CoA synthetase